METAGQRTENVKSPPHQGFPRLFFSKNARGNFFGNFLNESACGASFRFLFLL